MKINIEDPFKEEFKAAYVNTNKEPRRVCLLVRKDGTQTSMSYTRYLMSCHLKRYLNKDEHVDHIDNNKLNDVVENYQILSQIDNNNKKIKHLGIKEKIYNLICPICNKEFTRTAQRMYNRINPTCSKKCGGIKSHLTKKQI